MYEERRFRRGEIYRVRLDTGWDSEQGATRPALIISSNIGNDTSPVVIVAYMTTKEHNIGIHYGPTKATGTLAYVCCEQIATVNKKRILSNIMGSLTPNEMKEVDSRLDEVLDLGYVDNTPLREKESECDALRLQLEELKAENARLKKKDQQHEDELLTRDVEIAVHKRMYEKAVGIIAAMKAEPDLPKPPKYVQEIEQTKKVEETPKPPKNPKPPKPKEESKLVDINTATFSQLRGIGLSNSLVLSVINDRPYKKVEDLKKVPGLSNTVYRIVEKKVCCVPVAEPPKVVEIPVVVETPTVEEPKVPEAAPVVVVEENARKVNVNKASMKELMDIGLNKRSAQNIVSHRKKNGDYSKLEDLLNLEHFGNTCMKRYGHLLEV